MAVLLAAGLATLTLLCGYLGPAGRYVAAVGADPATVVAGTTYLRWFVPALAIQFALAAMGAALQGTGIVKPTAGHSPDRTSINLSPEAPDGGLHPTIAERVGARSTVCILRCTVWLAIPGPAKITGT